MSRALRILLVDADEPIVAALSAVLARRGHDVHAARSAQEALEHAGADVLVTELALAGFSGLELLERLHERGQSPHTVFLADDPSIEDCQDALRLGAAELLTKPFRLDDLVRAVEACAAAKRAARGLDRTYLSTGAGVEQAARDVCAYALRCGVAPATRARIASSTAELADNARRHAYLAARGRIHVRAQIDERDLVLQIADEGAGFDAARALDAACSPAAGGLARVRALAEELHVESKPGAGTRATARFAAYRADFDEDGVVDLTECDFFTPDLARRVIHALRKDETASLFRFSPSLAVVVGRLLAAGSVVRTPAGG